MAVDVEIVQPTVLNGQLMYQVKAWQKPGQNPVKRWIEASLIEESANTDDWQYAWWNRETEEYEDSLEDDYTD